MKIINTLIFSCILIASCGKKTDNGESLIPLIYEQENNAEKDSLISLYTNLFTNYPQHPFAASALYKTANYYAKNSEIEKSAELFRKYFQTYPDSSEAANSLVNAAFLFEQIDVGISIDLYKKFINTYPNDERVEDVKKNLPFVGKPAEYIMEQLIKQGKLREELEEVES
jgi:tetratricopeptide (TPR) repeat protein